MDIAKILLANSEGEPNQKALAQLAFENTHHEDALAEHLKGLMLPMETKADLWDAKKITRNDPRLHKLSQIANLPPEVLKVAEEHPNVMKLLMTEEKAEKGSEGAKEPKSKESAKEKKPVEPESAENAMPQKEPLDMTVPQGQIEPREPNEEDESRKANSLSAPQNEMAHDYHVDPAGQIIHTPNPLVQSS